MSRPWDCLVVGAGHNGLTAAAVLARSGRRVLVLEAREAIGGAAASEEIAPGYHAPVCAHLLYHLHPRIEAVLELARHGLAYAVEDLASVALDPAGRHLVLEGDGLRRLDGTEASAADACGYTALRSRLRGHAAALAPFLLETPPRLGTADWGDRLGLARLGWAVRRMGREAMRDFLRIALMNAADLIEEEIADPLLGGALAFEAVLGGNVGPRSPGTVLNLIYRATGRVRGRAGAIALPRGGMGAVSAALASAARAAGAEIRTESPVAAVLVENDRAAGVRLVSGEEIRSATVLSNVDARRSFLELLGAEHLDAGFAKRVTQVRSKGNAAKLNLALTGRPRFAGLPDELAGARLLIAPSIDALERAFNPTKYGELPEQPALEITVPSLHDPSLAPEGGHLLSAVVQYAPYRLKQGWAAAREGFQDRLLDLLEAYAPGLRGQVAAAQLLTPEDLEARYGMAGGHWHHGELIVDQMLMLRPLHGAAQYDTPVKGFYLCGAAAHPGGDVTGAAGHNAARRLIALEGRA